jgi:hypothetical protein
MSVNIVPKDENYCVVCDNLMTTAEEFDQVCSEECRAIFADFSVVYYTCKECLNCCREIALDEETDFCSDDCSQAHEESEYIRTHCLCCDIKMEEPITRNVCGDLCDKKLAFERYLEKQEEYIESKRQDCLDEGDY